MLLSFGIALFLVFTQPPVQEQAQARDSCVYLLISAMSCNAAAVGLQAHLLRCLYPSTQANWNHDSDQPPLPPSTSVLQIVSLRIHTIISMLPSQTLPPNPSQAPPSTCTIPILRISVRRVRPFIRLRALAFGSLAAQVAGVVLLTAALAYSESQHVSHTASVVGLCGMGVIALLQTLCLFSALPSLPSKRKWKPARETCMIVLFLGLSAMYVYDIGIVHLLLCSWPQ